jgi:hypothetical protein
MRRLKLGSLLVVGISILFLAFFQYTKHAPGVGTANPFGEDPYDAVGSFGVLLAPLAALLGLVRAFRSYPQTQPDPDQLRTLLHSGTVALLAIAVTLAADALGLGRALLIGGLFPAAGPLAELVAGMALLTLLASWTFLCPAHRAVMPSGPRPFLRAISIGVLASGILAVYPQGWREAGIAGGILTALLGMALLFVTVWAFATAVFPGKEPSAEDFFDDLSALFHGGKKRLSPPLAWLEKPAAFPPLRKVFDWLRPRRHRWHLVAVVAVLLGLLLLLPEMLVEGGAPNLRTLLLVAGVYIGIGAAGVLLGYVLLGEYLGIY